MKNFYLFIALILVFSFVEVVKGQNPVPLKTVRVEIKEGSAPASPITGYSAIYIDTGGIVRVKRFDGTDVAFLTSGTAVTSVFGRTGAVTAQSGDYTTTLVTEGTNLYFTNARARAALSTSSPLTYNSASGLFGITQSTTSTDGYLSSIDWNTFNNKGNGTVTSVALSLPSIFSVSGSPITTSGTLTGTLASQTANTVFAAPDGSTGSPGFRLLVSADIPNLDTSKLTSGLLAIARGGTNAGTSLGAFNNLSPLTTTGDILYFNGTNNARLGIGTSGQVLTVSGGLPAWAAAGGGGITGSGTTNTIAKFTSSSAVGNSNIADTGSLVTITGAAHVSDLTQTTTSGLRIGSGRIYDVASGVCTFGYNGFDINNYAFLQNSSFNTTINAATGGSITFRINNGTNLATLTSSTFTETLPANFSDTTNTTTSGVKIGSGRIYNAASGVTSYGYDGFDVNNYAVIQNNVFETKINAATGQAIKFLINNSTALANSTSTLWTTSIKQQFNDLVYFGGATSSFPALKRSSTTLQVRLADDSAPTAISSSTHEFPGSTSGTFTQQAAAATTSYTLTWPNAAPTTDKQTLSVTTSGVGSWANSGLASNKQVSTSTTSNSTTETSLFTYSLPANSLNTNGDYFELDSQILETNSNAAAPTFTTRVKLGANTYTHTYTAISLEGAHTQRVKCKVVLTGSSTISVWIEFVDAAAGATSTSATSATKAISAFSQSLTNTSANTLEITCQSDTANANISFGGRTWDVKVY